MWGRRPPPPPPPPTWRRRQRTLLLLLLRRRRRLQHQCYRRRVWRRWSLARLTDRCVDPLVLYFCGRANHRACGSSCGPRARGSYRASAVGCPCPRPSHLEEKGFPAHPFEAAYGETGQRVAGPFRTQIHSAMGLHLRDPIAQARTKKLQLQGDTLAQTVYSLTEVLPALPPPSASRSQQLHMGVTVSLPSPLSFPLPPHPLPDL